MSPSLWEISPMNAMQWVEKERSAGKRRLYLCVCVRGPCYEVVMWMETYMCAEVWCKKLRTPDSTQGWSKGRAERIPAVANVRVWWFSSFVLTPLFSPIKSICFIKWQALFGEDCGGSKGSRPPRMSLQEKCANQIGILAKSPPVLAQLSDKSVFSFQSKAHKESIKLWSPQSPTLSNQWLQSWPSTQHRAFLKHFSHSAEPHSCWVFACFLIWLSRTSAKKVIIIFIKQKGNLRSRDIAHLPGDIVMRPRTQIRYQGCIQSLHWNARRLFLLKHPTWWLDEQEHENAVRGGAADQSLFI